MLRPWPAQQLQAPLNLSPRPAHQPSQAGCKHCHDTPFASRPIARAKPEQGRYHNTLPAAPTFHPTAEEWEDPFAYLGKIAPEATKAGIALIVPPKGWEPPIQMLDQETGQLRTDLQVGAHFRGYCSQPTVSCARSCMCSVTNSSTRLLASQPRSWGHVSVLTAAAAAQHRPAVVRAKALARKRVCVLHASCHS